MTSFNAVGAILPLDEYWENCVHPKPLIPPRYPGAKFNRSNQTGHGHQGHSMEQAKKAVNLKAGHRHAGHRQAGHLRSYKDVQENENDDDEAEVWAGGSVNDSSRDSADSDFNSNVSQINYEMDDFNKTYCDDSSQWQSESPNSRSQLNAGQKYNVKSGLDRGGKNLWQKKKWNMPRYNNGCTSYNPAVTQNQNRGHQLNQGRMTMEQRMRYAFNSFRDNNNMVQSNDVPMNQNYNVQTIPHNPPQNMSYSSSTNVTSTINTVYNSSYVQYETMSSMNAGYAAGAAAHVNSLPEPSNNLLAGKPTGGGSSFTDNLTVQQVAHHVLLMMSTVRNLNTQKTPEFFRNDKSMDKTGEESQPQGFN